MSRKMEYNFNHYIYSFPVCAYNNPDQQNNNNNCKINRKTNLFWLQGLANTFGLK